MEPVDKYILIFDADNTLWDTNAVFLSAQVAMLTPFEEAGYLIKASDEIKTLREVDRLLMKAFNCHEYNFHYLVKALGLHYIASYSIKEATERTLLEGLSGNDVNKMLFNEALSNYKQELKRIPLLVSHASDVLALLKNHKQTNSNLVTVLFSEGRPERLEQIIQTYQFRENGFFNEVVIGPKSKEAFEEAKMLGIKHFNKMDFFKVKTIVVGDSLKRDIVPANEAGFTTVYIPGKFQGKEIPQSQVEQPSFVIESISQLPNVLKQLEFQLDNRLN